MPEVEVEAAVMAAPDNPPEVQYKGGALPIGCPPLDATVPPNTLFLRLVSTNAPCADDFRSCALEGKTAPLRCDPCTWLSCSFFSEDTPREKLADIARFKNHSDKKYIAYVRVNNDSGLIKVGSDGHHISFWMRQTFSPESSIEKVIPI